MFTSSPRFATLVQQVARILEEDIRRGALRETLPGERHLAVSLQVSRRTVHAAIQILRRRKLIVVSHGAESRIVPTLPPARKPDEMPSIGLLLPEPVEQLQPFATVFIDALRTLFYNNGYRIDTHIGHRYFSGRPGTALRRLVARFPCEGWILAFSNRACQAWFHAQAVPTVVVGTAHEGVMLPYVDIDMQATARHAATVLLRRGHRRIALVIEASERPGDQKTERGFLEGARQNATNEITADVYRHAGTVTSLQRLVARLVVRPDRPTALFIANPYHYLAVAGILAEKGLQVPRDVSLLCRDDDYCFRFLPTAPSRYVYNPTLRAKEIFATLMGATRHKPAAGGERRAVLILPEFVDGGSIARG